MLLLLLRCCRRHDAFSCIRCIMYFTTYHILIPKPGWFCDLYASAGLLQLLNYKYVVVQVKVQRSSHALLPQAAIVTSRSTLCPARGFGPINPLNMYCLELPGVVNSEPLKVTIVTSHGLTIVIHTCSDTTQPHYKLRFLHETHTNCMITMGKRQQQQARHLC